MKLKITIITMKILKTKENNEINEEKNNNKRKKKCNFFMLPQYHRNNFR
jgi:hypothetical protein